MRKSYFTSKLISSIFITIVLCYFMVKTPSPKIIFVPFLTCAISLAGKNLALILDKKNLAIVFSKLFVVGFLLFWFGFLVVAGYICIRDKNYSMLLFSVPFWFAGIYIIKNKLLNIKRKKDNKPNKSFRLPFGIVISVALVLIALLVGIMLLVQGIFKSDMGMIFAGAFFAFGAFTFVLAALTVKGYFDKLKIDVLGLYIGVLFTVIGIGIVVMIYRQEFGFWVIIPVLMIVAGVFQIVKCLKRN